MKCESCGEREATVHYKEIRDSVVREMNLCAACAEEKGFVISSSKGDFSVPNLLGSIAENAVSSAEGEGGPARCESCGLVYDEFKGSGRLGCAECYGAFRLALGPLLRRIHGSDRHLGKTPGDSGEERLKTRAIRTLKERLDRCVRMEEFEEAARIRDKIREMEEEHE
jgi:protein arginine kinase activator